MNLSLNIAHIIDGKDYNFFVYHLKLCSIHFILLLFTDCTKVTNFKKWRQFLPHYFVYIGWGLCVLLIAGCSAVTIYYGFRYYLLCNSNLFLGYTALLKNNAELKILVLLAYYLIFLSELFYSIYFQYGLHYYAFVTESAFSIVAHKEHS